MLFNMVDQPLAVEVSAHIFLVQQRWSAIGFVSGCSCDLLIVLGQRLGAEYF